MKLPWYLKQVKQELRDDGMYTTFEYHWLWKMWKWIQFRFKNMIILNSKQESEESKKLREKEELANNSSKKKDNKILTT